MPRAADFLAATSSAPAVRRAFGGVSGAMGVAVLSQTTPNVATNAEPGTVSIGASVRTSFFSPPDDMLLGLIAPTITGAGFEKLRFTVNTPAGNVIDTIFTSVATAQTYFTNNVF